MFMLNIVQLLLLLNILGNIRYYLLVVKMEKFVNGNIEIRGYILCVKFVVMLMLILLMLMRI